MTVTVNNPHSIAVVLIHQHQIGSVPTPPTPAIARTIIDGKFPDYPEDARAETASVYWDHLRAYHTNEALAALQSALAHLTAAPAPRAAERVRAAIRSCAGAVRHASALPVPPPRRLNPLLSDQRNPAMNDTPAIAALRLVVSALDGRVHSRAALAAVNAARDVLAAGPDPLRQEMLRHRAISEDLARQNLWEECREAIGLPVYTKPEDHDPRFLRARLDAFEAFVKEARYALTGTEAPPARENPTGPAAARLAVKKLREARAAPRMPSTARPS